MAGGRQKRKAVSNSEEKAKRAKGETNLKWDLHWNQDGPFLDAKNSALPLIYLSSKTLEGASKVAGFDIDFTLIKTASGRTFATGANDWEWLYDDVPDKLRELNKDGYRIAFFTNQAGIEKMKVTPETVKTKIEAMIEDLDIPCLAFISTGTNHFRKPNTTMWDYMEKNCNAGKQVTRSESLYVGDAAGRAKNWAPGKSKDFSCGDRMFAANVGVAFHTPEAFYRGEKEAKFEWRSADPAEVLAKPVSDAKEIYHKDEQELILMVGVPASGKSTFSKRYLVPHGYTHVNRDTLKTPAKCLKVTKESIADGKSVIVDNTNPAPQTRKEYIDIANRAGIPCRCFHMQTSLELSKHLNMVRMSQTLGEIRRIPDVAYNVFKSQFTEPTTAEGFTEVKKIPFSVKFDKPKDKEVFQQWTC